MSLGGSELSQEFSEVNLRHGESEGDMESQGGHQRPPGDYVGPQGRPQGRPPRWSKMAIRDQGSGGSDS